MTIGNPAYWSDVFPDHFIPDILDLVYSTWNTFQKPTGDELEVPITRRFKRDLKQAKDYRRIPFRIEREPSEDDPVTGEELGRIDLRFIPVESALEEVYFAFECKRLYSRVGGKWESLASKYVTEGVIRFVTGQYAARMRHGGMIGYILNGNITQAKSLVQGNLSSKYNQLRMTAPGQLAGSSLHPTNDDIRESLHHLDGDRDFVVHHVFLTCSAELPAKRKSAPRPKKTVQKGK